MNNATALHDLNRALAHVRRRQDTGPKAHSAREIAQMSMFAEYLYGSHTLVLFESARDAQTQPFHQRAA